MNLVPEIIPAGGALMGAGTSIFAILGIIIDF